MVVCNNRSDRPNKIKNKELEAMLNENLAPILKKLQADESIVFCTWKQ